MRTRNQDLADVDVEPPRPRSPEHRPLGNDVLTGLDRRGDVAGASRPTRPGTGRGYTRSVEQRDLADRQLEALLERLDRLVAELARLNRRQESREELTVIAHELRNLNESLQALAYAALGHQGPQVRRRRTG